MHANLQDDEEIEGFLIQKFQELILITNQNLLLSPLILSVKGLMLLCCGENYSLPLKTLSGQIMQIKMQELCDQ